MSIDFRKRQIEFADVITGLTTPEATRIVEYLIKYQKTLKALKVSDRYLIEEIEGVQDEINNLLELIDHAK